MVSINLRAKRVPPKTLFFLDSSTAPSGYTIQSDYYGKHIKQVSNNCVNPGTDVGNSTHDHGCGGGHSHAISCTSHTHTGATQQATSGPPAGAQSGSGGPVFYNHNHGFTTAPLSPSGTASCSGHSHGTGSNDVKSLTVNVIRKNDSVSVRDRAIHPNAIIMWTNSLASSPTGYNIQSAFYDRYYKGVPNACTSPLGTSCPSNHSHSASCHTHTFCVNTHGSQHGLACGKTGTGGGQYRHCPGPATTSSPAHTHSQGSFTAAAASAITGSTASDNHAHGGCNAELAKATVAMYKPSKVSMRSTGIPVGGLVMWQCTLATIPTGFALANGTACTPNLLNRFPKGIPCGSTDPGTLDGSNTHTHSGSCHTHGFSMNHTHTISGTTGCRQGGTICNFCAGAIRLAHTHGYSGSLSTSGGCKVTDNNSHTHTTVDHKPLSKEVAIIQQL